MSLDDDVLDLDAVDENHLAGEAALLASLRRGRTGRMGDIVATIQADQDRIIRADPRGILVVEGGPGTGKTVVALHRAAYLLYTHRKKLARRGILVIGPNATFLRYIDQVLPSLGENDVVLATIDSLFPGVEAAVRNQHRPLRSKATPRWQAFWPGPSPICARYRLPLSRSRSTAPPTGSRLAYAARPAPKQSSASIPTPAHPCRTTGPGACSSTRWCGSWPGRVRGTSRRDGPVRVAARGAARRRRGHRPATP